MAGKSCHLAMHLLSQLLACHACQRVRVVRAHSPLTLRTGLPTQILRRVRGRLVELESPSDVLLLFDSCLLLGLLLLPHFGEVWPIVLFTEDWTTLLRIEVCVILPEVKGCGIVDQSLVEVPQSGVWDI